MVRVRSRVRINTSRIRQINQVTKTALQQTAEVLHTEIVQAQIIPRMDGHLQNEKFYVDTSKLSQGKVKLTFEGPYARRLYYHPEYNFHQSQWQTPDGRQHDGNPNAKGHWFEDWLPNGKYQDFARHTFEELIRRNG